MRFFIVGGKSFPYLKEFEQRSAGFFSVYRSKRDKGANER